MQLSGPFFTIAVLLAAALLGGVIAHRLKQPIIIGYLVIGAVVGPNSLGLIGDLDTVEAAATIGVALLMFTLGMETSVAQVREVGRVGIWGGVAQIAVTAGLGILVGRAVFNWPLEQSVIFGLIISLSSTAVCLKIIMDRGELSSIQGRIMIAVLILQDIGVIFVSLIIPFISGEIDNLAFELALSVGKVAAFVVVAVLLGRWVLPWLLGGVGGFRSRELFLLTILVLCLGAAISTQIIGLSIIFGAFLVGLVLRETRFIHQALAEISPLRDIFVSLFFVSLGMLVDFSFVADSWPTILLAVGLILAVKIMVVSGIVKLFGYSVRVAVLTGVGLFQIGEFGFIIAQKGFDLGIVTDQFYSLIVSSAVITMILTPFALGIASRLYQRVSSGLAKQVAAGGVPPGKVPEPHGTGPAKRVIIAGFGETGESIAERLQEMDVPYIVIDGDPERISEARASKYPRIFGDATNINVLQTANLQLASALVVTYPDPMAVITTVKLARLLNPELLVMARVGRRTDMENLKKLGVMELVVPEREAGKKFVERLLEALGPEKS